MQLRTETKHYNNNLHCQPTKPSKPIKQIILFTLWICKWMEIFWKNVVLLLWCNKKKNPQMMHWDITHQQFDHLCRNVMRNWWWNDGLTCKNSWCNIFRFKLRSIKVFKGPEDDPPHTFIVHWKGSLLLCYISWNINKYKSTNPIQCQSRSFWNIIKMLYHC